MIRIGTRASKLAMWQANWTAESLKSLGHKVEIVQITTKGDTTKGPLHESGGDGLFTKQLQDALIEKKIDLAVHSLKDLPTAYHPELMLASVPKREDPRDAFVSNKYESIAELPEGAIVGTGSLRRQAQLLNLRSDLHIQDLRGNVDTRLAKLDAGDYDAIILASAGLRRLGLEERIKEAVSIETLLPAVGQGALGLETRMMDDLRNVVSQLMDTSTFLCTAAERAFLNETYAGCTAPVGGHARIIDDKLQLDAAILSVDGKVKLEERGVLSLDLEKLNSKDDDNDDSTFYLIELSKQVKTLGRSLAQKMIDGGAKELLDLKK